MLVAFLLACVLCLGAAWLPFSPGRAHTAQAKEVPVAESEAGIRVYTAEGYSRDSFYDTLESAWAAAISMQTDGQYLVDEDHPVLIQLMKDAEIDSALKIDSGYLTLELNSRVLRPSATLHDSLISQEQGMIEIGDNANFTLQDEFGTTEHYYYVDEIDEIHGSPPFDFSYKGKVWTFVESSEDEEYSAAQERGSVKGGVITGAPAGCIKVLGDGVFTMNGGTIAGNKQSYDARGNIAAAITIGEYSYDDGEWIYDDEPQFNLNGGTIAGNFGYACSAIYMGASGTATMSGGTISDHDSSCLIEVTFASSFVMTDGKIIDNKSDSGALIDVDANAGSSNGDTAKFIMRGGEISNNIQDDEISLTGDGLICLNNAEFTMSGGSIRRNSAYCGGAIDAGSGSKITITGGDIVENTAEYLGGAVYVRPSTGESSIIISGGTISGNEAKGNDDYGTADHPGSGLYVGLSSGDNISITGGELCDDIVFQFYDPFDAEISGGYISGRVYATSGMNFTVTGGYFTESNRYDVESYIAAGYLFASLTEKDNDWKQGYSYKLLPDFYTVVYTVGEETMEVQASPGEDITLKTAQDAGVTVPEGYVFGWTTHEDGQAVVYKGGQTIEGGIGDYGDKIVLYSVTEQAVPDLSELEKSVAQLQNDLDALEALVGTKQDDWQDSDTVISQITALLGKIAAVEAKIDDLENTYVKKEDILNLEEQVNALKQDITTAYENAINKVETELTEEIKRLEEQIQGGGADVTELKEQIAALTQTFNNAKTLINEKIENLIDVDSSLSSRISSLSSSITSVQNRLQAAIDNVAASLETTRSELETLLQNNKTEIENKLEELKKAYEAADALLRADFRAADEQLEKSLEALEKAYKAADDTLGQAIEDLRAENEQQDSELHITRILLYVVLGIAVLALVMGVIGTFLAAQAKKRVAALENNAKEPSEAEEPSENEPDAPNEQ